MLENMGVNLIECDSCGAAIGVSERDADPAICIECFYDNGDA